MKKVILGVAVVLALALFVSPSLAAPVEHKITYHGAGVTTDQEEWSYDLIGTTVRFAGMAKQDDGGSWTGRGTFVDSTNQIGAQLVVTGAGSDDEFESQGTFWGDARVTINGVYVGTSPFMTQFSYDYLGNQFYWLHIFRDDGTLQWTVAGTNVFPTNWVRFS